MRRNDTSHNRKIRCFDFFEPEATCLTEERFGGGGGSGGSGKQQQEEPSNHNAFGDGPKFVCGVEYYRSLKQKTSSSSSSSSSSSASKFKGSGLYIVELSICLWSEYSC